MRFLVIAMLVGLVGGGAWGASYWTDGGGDHLWTNPSNWTGGVPGTGDTAYVRHSELVAGGQGPEIRAGMDIRIWALVVNAGDRHIVLTMTGGQLECRQDNGGDGIRLGSGPGASGKAEFRMSGGEIEVHDQIRIGQSQKGLLKMWGEAKVYSPGLYMTGGGGMLEVGEESEYHIIRAGQSDLNPIMPGADPGVMVVGDTLWMYTTSGYSQWFYAYSTQDLVDWRVHGPVLRYEDVSWVPSGRYAWAPGVAQRNGIFYFYYSVGPKPSHIGVAWSYRPEGPYVDSGRALLSDNGDPTFEAIDAMVFEDPVSGKWYFYAGGSAGSNLRVFELNNDMLSFRREVSTTRPSYFTEGAFMHYRNGRYFMSYSNGRWNQDNYCVHYSTSTTPYGPWTYRGKILSSSDLHKGPGHHSFVYNRPLDEWYAVYHRWDDVVGSGPYSGSRQVAVDRLTHTGANLLETVVTTDAGMEPAALGRWFSGDLNEDDRVDVVDLRLLLEGWLGSSALYDIAPAGGDGFVDWWDFVGLAADWGEAK